MTKDWVSHYFIDPLLTSAPQFTQSSSLLFHINAYHIPALKKTPNKCKLGYLYKASYLHSYKTLEGKPKAGQRLEAQWSARQKH